MNHLLEKRNERINNAYIKTNQMLPYLCEKQSY